MGGGREEEMGKRIGEEEEELGEEKTRKESIRRYNNII